jgi:putative DNA primase/helicase
VADGEFLGAAPMSAGPSAKELSGYPLNDFGNAMRFIRYIGGQVDEDGEIRDLSATTVLYVRNHGWVGFNGQHWDLKAGEGLARKWAAKVARGMHAQAEILSADARERGLAKKEIDAPYDFAESCGNSGRMDAMLKVAKTYLEVDLDVFDRDPLALNVRNGTLFFRRIRDAKGKATGAEFKFRDHHDPSDRLSRMAEVSYDPKAEAPTFHAVLATWQPQEVLRRYLQVLTGYGMTGDTSEQIFIIFQGKGRDGKSTFMNMLRKLFGSYAATADVKTFLEQGVKGGGDASPDLARLAGDTRLVSTAEPPKNAKLSDDRIKSFTGGGNITARHLREGIFEFEPVGKVFMECNSRPQPQGSDEGIWRRLKLLLWENQIEKGTEDKELPHKLAAEWPGILNWIVEGIMRWLVEGVQDPPRVLEAIDEYRKGASPFAEWVGDFLVIDKKATTPASELYGSYKTFITDRDEKPMSQTAFGRALADLQIIRGGRDGVGRILRSGARLKSEAERSADSAAEQEGGAGGPSIPPSGGFDLPPEEDDDDPFAAD